MNYSHLSNLRLATRNEGKIKSYDSCTDIRAWNHDLEVQDRYLREWMKADMHVCYIPCSCLTACLSKMMCNSRSRVIPRCHPDCKSKLLLESICNSCLAVKECLMRDESLEKYFVEEDLETSQWPCNKILEPLKCIKMFWKILLDRILGINISKCNELEKNCEFSESLRSVARLWQSDMLQEVNFVQNTSLWKACNDSRRRTCSFPHCQGPYCIKDYNCNSCPETYVIKPPCQKKTSRSTCIRTKTIDCGCTASCAHVENKIYAYKNKIKRLQAKFNIQNDDLKKLRNENCMLRKEVEHVCLSCPWKASFFLPKGKIGCCHSVTVVPKPFECHVQDNCCPVSNIYSEMIITMKNGKNEVNTKALCLFMYQTADDAHNFRHVSLLQVLHKTNDPNIRDPNTGCKPCCNKEDPIEILNKVHNTVGAIVKREMGIANNRNCQAKNTEVDATFHRLQSSKSAPSCSTTHSQLSCEAKYACAKEKEGYQRPCTKVTNI